MPPGKSSLVCSTASVLLRSSGQLCMYHDLQIFICLHYSSPLAELKAQRPDHDTTQKFDSNCITPGTPFMVNLGKTLRFWVAKKLNEDPGWMNIKVILSDGSVPGEGEHKMMNFIRSQRASPHHNPNTSHVIYGLVMCTPSKKIIECHA